MDARQWDILTVEVDAYFEKLMQEFEEYWQGDRVEQPPLEGEVSNAQTGSA
jgi:hypothetical protein